LAALGIYLQHLIMLAGVGISSLLVWHEIDKENLFLKKVCSGIVKTDCNAILSSKRSKVFSWLSWSEVGLFYFTGGLLTLLFAGNKLSNSIAALAWINMLALPFTVFSIYYQWKIARQWCILCLAVQALLVLGGFNAIANSLLFPIPSLGVPFIANILLLYLLPVLMWYALKPHILRFHEAKATKRQYLRLKFNSEIFELLLKNQKTISIPSDGLGIELGNPEATNTIIKVCSTYCGPCSAAHPKIEKLLKETPNLKVKIIFAVSDPHGPAVKPVRHLLAIAEEGDSVKLHRALDDWYLPNKKDYDLFAAKYPMNGELLAQSDKIDAMIEWCRSTDINSTPTFFINGYKLPNAYQIEDIQYFLL
jgi:uncharacterized membrane protein